MQITDYFRHGLFEGQTALITGGGTGIGFLVARAFGQLGAHTVLASRDEDRLAEAVAELEDAGHSASFAPLNVRDSDMVYRTVDSLVSRHGRIDILFNNAGGQFAIREEDLSPNGWKAVIDLNLNGTFHCCSAVGRHMVASGGGKIINMAVSFTDRGSPGIAHRGAAAAGVVHLTRSLALAWADFDIQVNAIGPQYLTPGAKENYGAAIDQYMLDVTPMKRWGRDHEVAGTVLFLASPMADYTSGALVPVDGACFLGPGINYRGSAVLPD